MLEEKRVKTEEKRFKKYVDKKKNKIFKIFDDREAYHNNMKISLENYKNDFREDLIKENIDFNEKELNKITKIIYLHLLKIREDFCRKYKFKTKA